MGLIDTIADGISNTILRATPENRLMVAVLLLLWVSGIASAFHRQYSIHCHDGARSDRIGKRSKPWPFTGPFGLGISAWCLPRVMDDNWGVC